uniref:DUF4794 domain-containing protein n=1 Tax=Glossina palpalis gambiensis TaxID=67801 RepID=A0A1B0B0R7_9MUSC
MKELLLTLLLMAATHGVSMQYNEMAKGTIREITLDNREPKILAPQGPLLASFPTTSNIMKFIVNNAATSMPNASSLATSVVTTRPNEREAENTQRSTIFRNRLLKMPTSERPLLPFLFSTHDMMQYITREAAIAASRSSLMTTTPTTQISFDDQETDTMDRDTTSDKGQFKTKVLQRSPPPPTPAPFSALPSLGTNSSEMAEGTTGATAPAVRTPFIATTCAIAAPPYEDGVEISEEDTSAGDTSTEDVPSIHTPAENTPAGDTPAGNMADRMDQDETSDNGQFETIVLQRSPPPPTQASFSALPSVSTNFSEMTEGTTGARAPAVRAPFLTTTSTIAAPPYEDGVEISEEDTSAGDTPTEDIPPPHIPAENTPAGDTPAENMAEADNKQLTKSLPQKSTSSSTSKGVTQEQLFQQLKNYHNNKLAEVFKKFN